MTSAVKLSRISKSFGAVKVLDDIELSVAEGSFTSLLGPSGCGKTTLLNIIGGLERPSEGRISFGSELIYSERDVVDVPTERRNIGYVFQSYALWPHMTVTQNVGYPLRIRGVDAADSRPLMGVDAHTAVVRDLDADFRCQPRPRVRSQRGINCGKGSFPGRKDDMD